MSIKEITITNFLSYKSQTVTLSPNLNVFVGRNGSGKSNFFNSLIFVLADKFSIRGDERKMVENNIIANVQEDIAVQLRLDNSLKKLPVSTNEVVIMRRWTKDNKDEFFLNGKSVAVNQLNNVLQCFNISRFNPYNIIRQGKITKIANMRDVDLYEFLEDVSGVKLYEQKKSESLECIESLANEKEEIIKILKELSTQIHQLEEEREAYKGIGEIQAQIQIYEVQLALISTKNFRHQLLDLSAEQARIYTNLKTLREKEESISEELYRINRKVEQKEVNNDHLKLQQQQLAQAIQQREDTLQKLQKQARELEQKQYRLQGNEQAEDLSQNFEYTQLKEQLLEIEAQFKNKQQLSQELQAKIDMIQLMLTKNPVQALKAELESESEQQSLYEKDLKGLYQRFKAIEKDLQNIRIMASESEKPETIHQKLSEIDEQAHKLNKKRDQLQNQLMETTKNRQQVQLTLFKLTTDLEFECKNFDTRLKDVFSQSIFKIMDEARGQGYDDKIYGIFATMIQVQNQKLLPLIETAAGPRLFSLVVRDSETAKTIIDFNKKNQGCTLRIFALDLLETHSLQSQVNYPEDAIVLSNQVQLTHQAFDQNQGEKLKQKVLGRWLCVKDYETALEYAGPYNMNCITMENEVVFSEGFLTRVGATRQNNGSTRIMQFQKIIKQRADKLELEKKDLQLVALLDDLNNQSMQLTRELSSLKGQSDQLNLQLRQQDVSQMKEKENELQSVQKLIKQIEDITKKSTSRINELEKQLKTPRSNKKGLTDQEKENLAKLQREQVAASKEMTVAYNTLQAVKQQIYKLEQVYANQELKQREKNQISMKIAEIKITLSNIAQQIQSERTSLDDKTVEFDKWKVLTAEQEQGLATAYEERTRVQKQKDDIQAESDQLQQQMNVLEAQAKQYLEKIEKVNRDQQNLSIFDQEKLEEQQEKSKAQIIRKVKELKQKFNHKFTEKDKILFEKLDQIEERFDSYQQRFAQLKRNEEEFIELCKHMDSKSIKLVQDELFKKFQENFNQIFMKVVPTGASQVRLIKTAKRNKKTNQFLYGIDIRVAFKGTEMQNWYTFSQGEKTVIAFAIVIALQKCEPAPFYILDEFDAALDDNYRMQIASLYLSASFRRILDLSKNSQFLIITFRPELMNVAETKECMYHKVFFSNQQSSIRKTTQQEARLIIQQENKENQPLNK